MSGAYSNQVHPNERFSLHVLPNPLISLFSNSAFLLGRSAKLGESALSEPQRRSDLRSRPNDLHVVLQLKWTLESRVARNIPRPTCIRRPSPCLPIDSVTLFRQASPGSRTPPTWGVCSCVGC